MYYKKQIKQLLIKLHIFTITRPFVFFIRYLKKLLNSCIYLFFNMKKNYVSINNILSLSSYSLFITHSLGGGTKRYIENFNNTENIVFITNKHKQKSLLYSISYNNEEFLINKKQIILLLLNSKKIYINTLYTFNEWSFFLKQIQSIKKTHPNIYIQYMIHDYHCICPNLSLIHNNRFCNFKCKSEKCCFSLLDDYIKNINKWRKIWETFLRNIDSIICFSTSSKNYLSLIYPSISSKIKIIPHDMSYCKNTKINLSNKPFKLGIVGKITNESKGVYVLDYLAKNLEKINCTITLIGTEKNKIQDIVPIRKNEIFLGLYENSELQKKIIENEITYIAFISICPETFSYVLSELIPMNIPIIGFNIGAQAEKLKKYTKGIVVNTQEEMLDYLIKQKNN